MENRFRDPKAAADRLNSEFTRRNFLKATGLGAFALSTASILPAGCAEYEAPPSTLRVLNAKEYRTFLAAAETFLPSLEKGDPTVGDVHAGEYIDAVLSLVRSEVQEQVKQALSIFEHAPAVFNLKFARFTELSPEDRLSVLESWRDSALGFRRQLYRALRNLSCASYYSAESVWKSIDYDGPRYRDPIRPAR
ncbi:MAG: gluconate 2-dehydrogenase subunit 3 family protein [Vicinamibacteria bacterium]